MSYDSRVTLYPDGKYRWVYEVHMLRNYSILIDVYKVLGISLAILMLFNLLLLACDSSLNLKEMGSFSLQMLLIVGGIMLVLGFLGYFIFAWISGWKYVALFILDEKEVVHQQMPRHVKKAQAIGALTALAGILARRPGVVGAGLLSASHTSTTSVLANVKHVIPRRRMNLIKVNQLLNKNRIYVCDEDFDFVYQFLCDHCPAAS